MRPLPFLILLLLVTACNLGNVNLQNLKYRTVVKDATFKLSIPDFLDSTTRLNKEATLQFANGKKEFFMMVFSEPKEGLRQNLMLLDSLNTITDSISTLDAYFGFMNRHLSLQPGYRIFNESSKPTKKGAVKLASVNVTLDNIKVFYRVATIEANANFYRVYTWTSDKHREKYQPVMDSIINSLHEL